MGYCRYVFLLNTSRNHISTPYGMWLVYKSDMKNTVEPHATAFFFIYSPVILRNMQLFVMVRSDRVLLTVYVLLPTSVSVAVKEYRSQHSH